MQLKMFQVDAFTARLFTGNPAAVVILEADIDSALMQSIAAENNLSETAFINILKRPMTIRWFTPSAEVDLCGHAMLAAAKVLFDYYPEFARTQIRFQSRRGMLNVRQVDDRICLDFPADTNPEVVDIAEHGALIRSLGDAPTAILRGVDDYLLVFVKQVQIQRLTPDFQYLQKLDGRGVVVSARGDEVDFVSRCFYPKLGVDEDPVTGSAHTLLIPYWVEQLDKQSLLARQLSARGGELHSSLHGERVSIADDCVIFFQATITVG